MKWKNFFSIEEAALFALDIKWNSIKEFEQYLDETGSDTDENDMPFIYTMCVDSVIKQYQKDRWLLNEAKEIGDALIDEVIAANSSDGILEIYLKGAEFIPEIGSHNPREVLISRDSLGIWFYSRNEKEVGIKFNPNAESEYFDFKKNSRKPKTHSSHSQTKEKNTLLKILLGIAIKKYSYDPNKSKNPSTGSNAGSIQADLQEIGFEVDNDTIRNYLSEAAKKFNDKLKK